MRNLRVLANSSIHLIENNLAVKCDDVIIVPCDPPFEGTMLHSELISTRDLVGRACTSSAVTRDFIIEPRGRRLLEEAMRHTGASHSVSQGIGAACPKDVANLNLDRLVR